MPTFPKGHSAYIARLENAKIIATLGRHALPERQPTSRFEFNDPVDLRGIPAIGRGVSGSIPGTQPENAATR